MHHWTRVFSKMYLPAMGARDDQEGSPVVPTAVRRHGLSTPAVAHIRPLRHFIVRAVPGLDTVAGFAAAIRVFARLRAMNTLCRSAWEVSEPNPEPS